MSDFDIESLLRKLSESTGSSSKSSSKSKGSNTLSLQEQADTLRVSAGAFTNPPPLKVGDLVRYRAENAPFIRHHDRLSIVIEFLDPPKTVRLTEDNVGNCIAYRQYDTVIATTDHTSNGGVLKYLCDKRDLELWPDGDKLKSQHS